MNYTQLIKEAWRLTWRYKFLWILGLLAGSSAGTCSGPGLNFNFQIPGNWRTRGAETSSATAEAVARSLVDNFGLVLLLIALLILIGIVWLVISLIAQGGMAQATADLARGRGGSFADAMQAGLRLFWRYLRLWLLMFVVVVFSVAVAAGVAVLAVFILSVANEAARVALIVLVALLVFLSVLVILPLAVLFNIVLAFAQRAIAVEDAGAIAALGSGIRLLRSRLGASLLVWLLGMGLSIGVGIIVFLAMLALGIPMVLLGVLLVGAFGVGTLFVVYVAIAVLVALVVMLVLASIGNAYFWNYWTLAYLRLRGEIEL